MSEPLLRTLARTPPARTAPHTTCRDAVVLWNWTKNGLLALSSTHGSVLSVRAGAAGPARTTHRGCGARRAEAGARAVPPGGPAPRPAAAGGSRGRGLGAWRRGRADGTRHRGSGFRTRVSLGSGGKGKLARPVVAKGEWCRTSGNRPADHHPPGTTTPGRCFSIPGPVPFRAEPGKGGGAGTGPAASGGGPPRPQRDEAGPARRAAPGPRTRGARPGGRPDRWAAGRS